VLSHHRPSSSSSQHNNNSSISNGYLIQAFSTFLHSYHTTVLPVTTNPPNITLHYVNLNRVFRYELLGTTVKNALASANTPHVG
jgi:hypothetical protein